MKFDPRARRELLLSLRDGFLVGVMLFTTWFVGLSLFADEIRDARPRQGIALTALLNRHAQLAAGVCLLTSLAVTALRIHGFIQARLHPSHLELFDKLTESLPGMLYQYRQYPAGRGSVTYATHAIRSIYEMDPEEARSDGTKILDLVHPDDRDRIWASLVDSHLNLTPWKEEYRVVLPRAGICWRYGHARVERLPDAGTLWHGFVLDLTKEKTASLELAVATRKAEAANLAKSRFLAMMSHDIRTPMNGIVGFATLLRDTPLLDSQREYLSAIEQSADSLVCLVNDILDLSKIEAGRMTIESRPFALAPCLREVLNILRPRALEKKIALDLEMPGTVPEGIETDRTRLVQILTNLIGNAVKFTEQGGVKLRVSCDRLPDSQAPAQWSFQVIDSGIGMTAAHLQRIFEPFSQIDGLHRHEGTGLGLAITRQLCQQMGGEVQVESVPGRGTTFTATLLAPVAEAEESARPDPAAETIIHTFPRRRALVVDDQPLNAKLAGLMLRRAGFEARLAYDAENAISACRDEIFDIVLMDIQMPRISGLEATRELRRLEARGELKSPRPLHIVALTANVLPEDRTACLEAGMNGYLEKPLRQEALHEALACVRESSGGVTAFDCKDSAAA